MTRNRLAFAALLCLLALQSHAADEKKPAEKSDKDKLQGTWVMLSYEFMGMRLDLPKGKQATMTLKGEKATLKDPDKPKADEGSFKIDEKKTPKEIDLTTPKQGNPKVMETTKGIYQLDGDSLKIAFPTKGAEGPRPTAFDAKEISILTFTRKK